jgi:hypothetical protein
MRINVHCQNRKEILEVDHGFGIPQEGSEKALQQVLSRQEPVQLGPLSGGSAEVQEGGKEGFKKRLENLLQLHKRPASGS